MPLTEYKVTPEEQAQQGVVAEVGNKLNGTVAQNKAVFDRLCNFLIAKYNQVLDLIYTKAETDAQINAKITEIGSGDMAQAVYDPTGQKKDVFEEINKKANSAHTHTKEQVTDFDHTHTPTDLTSPIPLHKGGTNGSDVFQGSYNLRREIAVGVPGSVSATGWFLIGEQGLDAAFTTAGTVIAVNGGNDLGSGILKLHTRVDSTAGVLTTSISKLTWMCTDGKINPEHFVIDASSGTLKLYVYITGAYKLYMFSILDEYLTGDVTNRSRAFNMTRNYASPPVVGVNYLTSITKTLVSTKEPTNYVQSTSPTGAVAGDLWAW